MAIVSDRTLRHQKGVMLTLKMDGMFRVFPGVTDLGRVMKVCIE